MSVHPSFPQDNPRQACPDRLPHLLWTQVNDAACWIIGHLRAHHEQWAVSSGAGRSLLSGTVRGLVPNRALSSDAIWAEVVACVSKDPCVRCVIDSQGEKRWEWVGYPEGVPARG